MSRISRAHTLTLTPALWVGLHVNARNFVAFRGRVVR